MDNRSSSQPHLDVPNRAAQNRGVASGIDRAPRVPGALPRSLSGAHRLRQRGYTRWPGSHKRPWQAAMSSANSPMLARVQGHCG